MGFSVEYIYRILDQYTGPLNRITQATQRFQDRSKMAEASVHRLSGRLEGISGKLTNFGTVIGGAAITAGIFKFAHSASTLNDAMADVSRVTNLTGPALLAMQEKLQRLGRATGRSAEGLAAIAYEGGKLGIANEDMVSFVEMVMKTAAAFDMADSEAGRAIGSIRAKLGLSVSSVNELMQRVNFLADNTSASGNSMIDIIERTSGTFKTLGIPTVVTAGWAAFANQVEVTPELAASGLNMMMVRMMQMPGMLNKMLKDPQNAVMDFLKRFEAMPEAKRGAAILKTFGTEAGRFVMKAVANTKLLDSAMMMAGATEALGSMDREFANILARSSTAAERIKQTFIDISRSIGGVFIKVFDKYSASLISATQWTLGFVKAHPGLVKVLGAVSLLLAGLAAVVVPIGVLLSLAGAALPILGALAGVIGAISWPVVAVVVGIGAMAAIFAVMWYKSTALRQSLLNLYDAFAPLIDVIKQMVIMVGQGLAWAFGNTGSEIQSWGDIAALVINSVAAAIRSLFDIVNFFWNFWAGIFQGDLVRSFESIFVLFDGLFSKFEMLQNFRASVSGFLDKIGLGPAREKAGARQDNKVEISGQIGVSATGGAKVERAQIGLNQGYNLAVAR